MFFLGVGGRMVFCYKKGHEMVLAVKNKVGSLLTVGKVVCNFGFVCPNCYTTEKQMNQKLSDEIDKISKIKNVKTCKCLGFPINLARS